MSFRDEIKEVFIDASQNDNNFIDGKIDWGWVEADVMVELGVDRIVEEMGSIEAFYPLFDSLVEAA